MMLRLAFAFVLCMSVSGVAAEFNPVTVFESRTEGYNIYRIPAVVRATNGDLLAFCEARVGGDASEIDLVLKRSTDDGATWGPIVVVEESNHFRSLFGENPPPITIGNAAPVVDELDPEHPGRVWLPFTLENDRVFVTYSDDHGKTWSQRREITKTCKLDPWGWYATGPVHSIQVKRGPHKGRLVIPCDHRLGEDGADRGSEGSHAIISDDHGKTWRLGAIDDSYEDTFKANETTVVELNDGRLYFNSRDQRGDAPGNRGGAYSSDGGATFDTSEHPDYVTYVPSGERDRHTGRAERPAASGFNARRRRSEPDPVFWPGRKRSQSARKKRTSRHASPLQHRRNENLAGRPTDPHRPRCIQRHGEAWK